jgi:hypothetical protein
MSVPDSVSVDDFNHVLDGAEVGIKVDDFNALAFYSLG